MAGRAGFGQSCLEDLMNFWIFVFVFDLISTLLHVDLDGLFVGERHDLQGKWSGAPELKCW